METMGKPDRYLIEAAARVLDVLELFNQHEQVRLADVVDRLQLVKSTAFRLLYTLEAKGLIERLPTGRAYRKRMRYRVAMLSVSKSLPFVAEVESGIEAEARRAGLDFVVRHHEFDSTRVVGETEALLASNPNLFLCYNPDEHHSHVIADRCAAAGIPVLGITFPVPGARLFGINNYRAGLCGGEGIGEQISRRWFGAVDRVVVLDIPGSSPAQRGRNTGMVEGLRRNVRVADNKISHVHIDRSGDGPVASMRKVLDTFPRDRRMVVLCYNDANALGAMKAAEEADRSEHVAILSQGGVAEVRAALRKARSSMWSAVAHFPERFGERLMPHVVRVLRGEPTPPIIYTEHVLLTKSNLDRYYPPESRAAVQSAAS
jgi:ribose transport system substrate-binding protein